MATTSFTIYSCYDPEKDKERLQRETGQLPDGTTEHDSESLWRQAASAQFLRTQRPPPKFVPATVPYEVGDGRVGDFTLAASAITSSLGNSLSSWYHSLTTLEDGAATPQPAPTSTPSKSAVPLPNSHKEARALSKVSYDKDEKHWFIQKLLKSEASSTAPTAPPTLADILARSPPPLPAEPKYTPPVWIEIGPSNKGFAMLQRGGWNEGEALGSDAIRQRSIQPPPSFTNIDETSSSIAKGKQKARLIESGQKRRPRVTKQDSHDCFGGGKRVDVIDLTLSDSEGSSDDPILQGEVKGKPLIQTQGHNNNTPEASYRAAPHGRTALLTPIATVLKLDRLGIGLKAKTSGPYKTSVKRVTHNAAALAAHIRAAEEAQRRRERFGRGRRGYERQRRKEEDKRRDLLAYMNT